MKKLIILVILLLSACVPSRFSGKVMEKKFIPEHTYTTLLPVLIGKTTMLMPITHLAPDEYAIRVYSNQDAFWVDVGKDTYDSCQVGNDITSVETSTDVVITCQ